MSLLVIYNPVCGDSSGRKIVEEQVLPLLSQHNRVPDKVVSTQHAGHAGAIVLDFLLQTPAGSDLTIILVSGDGTLHEIANALYKREAAGLPDPIPTLKLVLIAGGTANALHASLFPPSPEATPTTLSSLHAYLAPTAKLQSLVFAETLIYAPGNDHDTLASAQISILSAVVASTSLHASILHDAEALRATVPSLERFKIAAAENATRWYNARLRLLPSVEETRAPLLQYDPSLDRFIPTSDASAPLELAGPFSYMLSTVNVDRLEPAFRITPLQKSHPSSQPSTMDIAIIRPHRDPAFTGSDEAQRELFKDKIWAAMGAAYQDGAHVKLSYDPDGKVTASGTVRPVVEYFRAAAWEWIPDKSDERAHLVCADGTILVIPKGGKAISRVLRQHEQGFDMSVYS